jgi:hypothetical protein
MKLGLAIAVVVAVAMALPASAQPGCGPNRGVCQYDRTDAAAHDFQSDGPMMRGPGRKGRMPRWNPETVTTIRGEVEKVGHRRLPRGVKAMGMVMKTEDGKMPVLLGPAGYLKRHEFPIDKNDKLTVTGSVVEIRGKKVMLAQKLERDTDKLILRTEKGRPMWAKRGDMMRGGPGRGMMRGGRGMRGGHGGCCCRPMDCRGMDREMMGPNCPSEGFGRRGDFRGQGCPMPGPDMRGDNRGPLGPDSLDDLFDGAPDAPDSPQAPQPMPDQPKGAK